MRVAMLTQWLRAARQCPSRRGTCIAYAVSIALAQLGWVVTAIVDTSLITFALIAGVLIAVECVGPYLAERHGGPSAAVCTSQPVAETAAPRPCWRMKCAATSTRPRLSRGKATSTAKTQRAGQCTAGGVKESRRASSRAMAAVNSP